MITPSEYDNKVCNSFISTDVINDDIGAEARAQLNSMKPTDVPAKGHHYEGRVTQVLEWVLKED